MCEEVYTYVIPGQKFHNKSMQLLPNIKTSSHTSAFIILVELPCILNLTYSADLVPFLPRFSNKLPLPQT